jgi:HAD superfamily hydrolase (TIGR01509 family)
VAIRGLVFDLFGTLVTRRDGPRAYRELILALPTEHWLRAREVGLTEPIDSLTEFAGGFPGSEALDLPSYEALLREDLDGVELFADSIPTLEQARARGLRVALISNLAAPYRQPFFRLGLAAHFDATVFSCDVGLAKPDPKIYAHVQAELGLAASELMMIGDSRSDDVLGPRAVGMRALHLDRRGRGDVETLAELFDHL